MKHPHCVKWLLTFSLLLFLQCKSDQSLMTSTYAVQKDTTILTPMVRIDTITYAIQDTIIKRNVVVSYAYDTLLKRIKLKVLAKPETIKIRQVQKVVEQKALLPKEKEKPFWKVVVLSSATTFLLVLLLAVLRKVFT